MATIVRARALSQRSDRSQSLVQCANFTGKTPRVQMRVESGRYLAVRKVKRRFSIEFCYRNAYIKTNGFTMHRNPIAQSTDGVRAKHGFNSGRHCWEVWWDGPLGTVAVIGIATRLYLLLSFYRFIILQTRCSTMHRLHYSYRQRRSVVGLESCRWHVLAR